MPFLAATALSLCSRAARRQAVTGTIHYVDNGMHAMGLSLDSSNFKEYIDKQVPFRVGRKLHAHISCPPLRNLKTSEVKPGTSTRRQWQHSP
jgi:hypothetical protein